MMASYADDILDELGNWRQERNKFSRSYFNAYHSHVAKSYPEEDYDDRNALYAMYELLVPCYPPLTTDIS